MRQGGAVVGFEMEIDGITEVSLGLGRMIHAIEDMSPFWDAFHSVFVKVEAEQFASAGAAGRSGPWRALSPSYAAWKARKYPGQGILVASGKLRDALTGGAGHVYEKHAKWAAFGANTGEVPYGIYHQRGTGKMPARKPISVSRTQEIDQFGRAVGYVAREFGKMWMGETPSASVGRL